ncbi:MAG: EAL domain-containing protein [Alphaproteobacteria bacterium]|jgi:diguanylate cyclase (GGDEF)-like protein|nr:EAL domain-containing protein [Alphaproteobacteria bacterium]
MNVAGSPPKGGRFPRVLIIDFDDPHRAQLEQLLHKAYGEDSDLHWREAGDEALIELATGAYDLAIFLDTVIDGQGLDAVREACTISQKILYILITDAASPAFEADIIENGTADCVALDDLTPALMQRIRHHAGNRLRAERTLRDSNDELVHGILRQRRATERAAAQSRANDSLAAELAAAKTELEAALLAARHGEQRLRRLAEHSAIGLWLLGPDDQTIFLNPSAAEILERGEDDGQEAATLESLVRPDERPHLEALRQAWGRGEVRDLKCTIVGPVSGREKHLFVSGAPLLHPGDHDGSILLSLMDISERTKSDAMIEHLAHHDDLTGLPNRTLFQDRLKQALALAQRTGKRIALLFLDVDNFKDVNDTMGHAAGDQLLRTVSERLLKCTRSADTVARLGGDEFAIICTNLDDANMVLALAGRIVEAIAEPFQLEGARIHTSASIGITLYPDDTDQSGRLIKFADMALYHAKAAGRNCFRFFDIAMDEEVHRRKALEEDLRQAISDDTFSLLYQPQLRLGDGVVYGAEALVRWNHPERGTVPPLDFIPLAESTGMIRDIGHLVLRMACTQARAWADTGHPAIKVAVNLSAVELMANNLLDRVKAVLAESGLPPERLELEITESAVMTDMDKAIAVMGGLRDVGVSLAIDDFGTGFSSLAYLKKFPVQALKIDRSFVQDILLNPEDAAIASAIISLGQSLNLEVIAEGVEEAAQADHLRAAGCGNAQGYYFGRPVPAAEFFNKSAAK